MAKKKAKKKTSKAPGNGVSWRSIRQQVRGRAETPAARGRRNKILLRFSLCLAIGGAGGLTGLCIYLLNTKPATLEVTGPVETVGSIAFETDGLLTGRWLREQWSLTGREAFSDIDIFALRDELESAGQVKKAVVERVFPDELHVVIEEHRPVLRLAVRGRDGRPELLLVSETGVVYRGSGYNAQTLERLPYLAGVRPRRVDGHYRPIEGLEPVVRLLKVVRGEYPQLYRDWKVVSCADYDARPAFPGSVIRVKTHGLIELVFAPADFQRQLDRLERIFVRASSQGLGRIERIDLSLEQPVLAVAEGKRPRAGPPARL